MKTIALLAFLSLALCYTSVTQADTFGSGPNLFDIDFVTIRDPGNAADTSGAPNPVGAVSETFRMGVYEVSEDMIDKANLETTGTLSPLNITHDNRGVDKPATSISWLEAARFVNWLNTSSSSTPAYKFDAGGNFQLWQAGDAGYDSSNVFRNSEAKYFLPSVDEWYKAAFYDPTTNDYFDYPTGSDSAPIAVASGTAAGTAVHAQSVAAGPADIDDAGGLSPSGTMAQGGNVWEWEESELDLINNSTTAPRGFRGGSWGDAANLLLSAVRAAGGPDLKVSSLGFRVASIGLAGDFDGDLDGDAIDFLKWQRGFGSEYDETDFADWETNYGGFPPPLQVAIAHVPEPTMLALALAVTLCLAVGLGPRRRMPQSIMVASYQTVRRV